MHLLVYLSLFVVLAGLLLFAWMTLIETRRFRIWEVKLPCRANRGSDEIALPDARLPSLNILHITDTHFGGNDGIKLDFLRSVLRGSGVIDFVFLTGDILDSPPGLDSCFELAGMIEPRVGSYAVLGGHDYYRSAELWRKYLSINKKRPTPSQRKKPNPVRELRSGLCERGVVVLEEENRKVELPGGERVAIVGLNDTFFFNCDYDGAWEGTEGLPAIVLAHSPDVLPEAVARGAELAFFGHTHGGQVRIPFRGAVITRSKVGARRARGIFREGETIFTINQGMGATRGTHIRFCCPPEVTLLRIGGNEFEQSYIPMAVVKRNSLMVDS